MSYRKERFLSLISQDVENKDTDQLKDIYKQQLNNGIHGLCFSPYQEGQQPGDQLSEAQVRRRLEIIRPYTDWVRSFSTTEGNELIPVIAKEMGMKTLVGAWLGDDDEINNKEVEGLVNLCKEGMVDVAAVGNEVMYRGDLTEAALLDFLQSSKSRINNVPVGYVDAYYEFALRPEITEACDVILANCYPFWEGCAQEYSLLYMKDMYRRAVEAAKGKRVIITETGWPDQGTSLHGAVPSESNALKYFINAQQWSRSEGIELFYFSSFDESWKVGAEGDVGAYWGIWDKDEKFKY
jgi:glucan 1,3-beta-glucosidase